MSNELETVSLGNHTVITHIPCPNCGEFGNSGLKDTSEFAVVECISCGERFKKEM